MNQRSNCQHPLDHRKRKIIPEKISTSASLTMLKPLTVFSSVQSFSRVWIFATPRIAARQPSLSITNSWSLLKLMSIESVMLLWITCICIRCTCIWITGGCHSGESFGFYDWGGATVTSVYMPEILLNILSPQNSFYLKELSGAKYPYCLDLEKAKELEIKLPASIGS